MHEHVFVESWRHQNDDRVRTRENCAVEGCSTYRFSCEAKRLDADGLESWGPVGKKVYSSLRSPEKPNG